MIKKIFTVCYFLLIFMILSACTSFSRTDSTEPTNNVIQNPESTAVNTQSNEFETVEMPAGLLFAVGLSDNTVAIYNGENVATIDDAELICEEDGYIYYLCGDQIRRVYYTDTSNPELIEKDNGGDWKQLSKVSGTDYYYYNNYGAKGFYVQVGNTATVVRDDLPNDNLKLSGDKYIWFDYNHPQTTDVYYYSIPNLELIRSESFNEDLYNSSRTDVYGDLLFYHNTSFDLYNYKTQEFTPKVYQLQDMIGLLRLMV